MDGLAIDPNAIVNGALAGLVVVTVGFIFGKGVWPRLSRRVRPRLGDRLYKLRAEGMALQRQVPLDGDVTPIEVMDLIRDWDRRIREAMEGEDQGKAAVRYASFGGGIPAPFAQTHIGSSLISSRLRVLDDIIRHGL